LGGGGRRIMAWGWPGQKHKAVSETQTKIKMTEVWLKQ
jgi:hypothetical protein